MDLPLIQNERTSIVLLAGTLGTHKLPEAFNVKCEMKSRTRKNILNKKTLKKNKFKNCLHVFPKRKYVNTLVKKNKLQQNNHKKSLRKFKCITEGWFLNFYYSKLVHSGSR